MAGAQDLPGSTSQAQTDALTYVTKNGLSTANTTITFTCTSNTSSICLTGDGRYDTIVVTQKAPSPTYFGGVLSVMGFHNCWVTGCIASASAAGCRGACGPGGNGLADVMMVLDHSYSMSPANMTNSKNATHSMFGNFNYNYQRVGLVVTPPVQPGNPCQSIKYWTDPSTWIPAPLTATYQTAPHTLNNSSPPVSETNCVDITHWPGGYLQYIPGHTNLGDPLKAATDELVAHGRANTTWGIIMITDGAANVAPSTAVVNASTGQMFCTSQAAITTNSGDNDGYEAGPSNTCANDASSGSDANSGTGNQTSCADSHKDRHKFTNFGVGPAIPSSPTPTVDGIEIRLDTWASSSGASQQNCVELSWDGGTSWTSPKTVNFGTSQATDILGNSGDNWGHIWTTAQLSNANFVVRVTDVASNTSTTFHMDAVAANVYYHYTDPTLTNKGPCDWAGQQATKAKALGIIIYTIAFGATDSCDSSNGESGSSAYNNMSSANFLKSLATDASHFYNTPKSTDLTAIFNSIGSQLASGSRLVSCSGC